jgi:hypothetical protein
MKPNEKVRDEIFQIIKNQLDANDPPETKITYDRLRSLGYNEFETKQLIGQCVALEIFDILKHNQPFNKSRYIKNLSRLPKETFE